MQFECIGSTSQVMYQDIKWACWEDVQGHIDFALFLYCKKTISTWLIHSLKDTIMVVLYTTINHFFYTTVLYIK